MATRTQFQWLFHLPSALRCRIIFPLERNIQDGHTFTRAFSNTTRTFARPSKSPPPPPRSTGSSSGKKSAARAVPKPALPSSPPSRLSSLDTDFARLLHDSERILLYKAPSHKSFFFSSYLFGSILIGSSVIHASFTQEDKKIPWFSRLLTSGLAIFLAVMGTAFILAPSKMIRSVSLARNQITNARFLSFQTKPAFPFVGSFRKGNVINAPLHEVYIDRAINGNALPPYMNIPLQDAEKFTQFDARAARTPTSGIWSNLWWDTRRMFLRDGMVYVEIPGHGHWKLDLRNAELLDNGKPLTATMVPHSLDRSIAGWLRAATGR